MGGRLTRGFGAFVLAALSSAAIAHGATTVLLGDTVLCDASASEGHPSSYEWYVTEPLGQPPAQPYATGVSFPLLLDATGTWTVVLVARYPHHVPGGGTYQSQDTETINVKAVVAELTLSDTVISTEEALELDGSGSRWASGVTPHVTWKIDLGPWTACNGGPPPSSPDELHCTIPAGALAPGDHVAKLQLYDPVSGDIHQRIRPFTVYEPVPLAVDFGWEPANPDPGELVQLEILVEPPDAAGDLLTATWDWDDGGPVEVVSCQTPWGCLVWSHSFASAGWYDVHLVVETADESAEVTRTIQIGDPALPPNASFTAAPTNPQLLHQVSFTFTGSCEEPCSYAWSFGDGAAATIPNPSHAYAVPNTYSARLVVTNDGGSDSAQAPIVVSSCWTPPAPAQTGSCYGGLVTLSAAGGVAWLWSTGQTSQSILVRDTGGYWADVDSGGSCWGHSTKTVELLNCGDPGGDANLDGTTDAADLPALVRELTDGDGEDVVNAGGGELSAPGGDINRDGLLNAADVDALLAVLFGAR
jgi:PKD repeat protein